MKKEEEFLTIDHWQPFFTRMAQAVSDIIGDYYRSPIEVESKNDDSPVTIADRKTETRLRELILEKYPDHGILGEEYGDHNPGADFRWILDPIDGTKSFIAGVPLFGTLIALAYQGVPRVGLIYQPITGEFMIGDSHKTIFNDRQVKLRTPADLSEATVLATDCSDIEHYQNLDAFHRLIKQAGMHRTWGDCYGYMLVAAGLADVMIDPIMSPWDINALVPIIEGAGGVITDYQGKDVLKGNSSVAAHESIHAQVIEILNS